MDVKNRLVLRDADPDDAAVIAEIYNEWVAAGGVTMDDRPKRAEDVRRMLVDFGPREAVLLLEADDETVGWGVIKRYSDRPGYRFACETSVYLRHRWVGRGFGPYIKKALISRCRAYGYRHLVAKIFASNVRSIEYNKRLGYEVVGTQREIGWSGGRWQDVVILQLILADIEPAGP